MPTDLFKQVLFNDGQGITQTDFNNLQRYLESKVWDQIIHNSIGSISTSGGFNRDPDYGGQDGTDHPTSRAYCLNPGQAFLRPGTTNLKINIAPGTLLQKLASASGDDPKLLAYTFVGTEEWTLTNGDATNPRVDLLQMKLEYVDGTSTSRDFEDATTRIVTSTAMNITRRVQCTLSVKAGTPAASPVVPEPDTGCVPVGSVVVGATFNGTNAPIFGVDTAHTSNAVVHDQRMPVRVRAYTVEPTQFKLITAWALTNNNSTVTSSNATNDLFIPCPAGLGRLIGVSMWVSLPHGSPTIQVGCSTGILTATFTARNTVGTTLNQNYNVRHFTDIENFPLGVGPAITSSVTTRIGCPIWSTGLRSPYEMGRLGTLVSATSRQDRLVIRFQSGQNSSVLGAVTFYVAEGF